MKQNFFKITTLLLAVFLISFSSCKKKEADIQSAQDGARGSYILADAFALSKSGNGGKKALEERFADCSFTFALLENGFKLTFDNCTDSEGITRDGTIIVTADANAFSSENAGSITITFEAYTIENIVVKGRITARYKATDKGFYFEIIAEDLRMDYPDGTYAIYNKANLKYEFNYLSGLFNNFKMKISGKADGINRNGQHFKTETKNMEVNLFESGDCPWPTNGTMTIKIDGEKTMTLDYDTGTCGEVKVSQKRHKKETITIF